MSVLLRVTGYQADALRNQIASIGKLEMAKARLQHYVQRFFKAVRMGEMAIRDDRSNNEIFLAEAFEAQGFTGATDKQKRLVFSLEGNPVVSLLPMPDSAPRRAPFALRYPCNIVHVIKVESPTLKNVKFDRHDIESPFFQFRQTLDQGWGKYSMSLKFSTLAAAVPADRVGEHIAKVAQVRKVSSRILLIPAGYKPPAKRKDFGVLPPLSSPGSYLSAVEEDAKDAGHTTDSKDAESAGAITQEELDLPITDTPRQAPQMPDLSVYFREPPPAHRSRSRSSQRRKRPFATMTIIAILLILFTLLCLMARR